MPRPRTIHDFYGFPPELFEVEYPAPGDAALAEEVSELARADARRARPRRLGARPRHLVGAGARLPGGRRPGGAALDRCAPGPRLSTSSSGARLAPLRDSGILIVGSGNVVHNLRLLDWSTTGRGVRLGARFDHAAREVILEPRTWRRSAGHPDYARSVPTPDHFLPLLYVAGLAAASKRPAARGPQILVDGYAMGSLSMTAYTLDAV